MLKIYDLNNISIDKILTRENESSDTAVESAVSEIVNAVKKDGDRALFYYGEKFDKVCLSSLKVTEKEILDGYNAIDKKFLETLSLAKNNIETFHKRQIQTGFEIKNIDGSIFQTKSIASRKSWALCARWYGNLPFFRAYECTPCQNSWGYRHYYGNSP